MGKKGFTQERRGTFLLPLAMATATLAVSGVSLPEAQAMACANEQARAEQGYASQLPDCRAYEQVSPVNKNNTDAVGAVGQVQSAPSGGSVLYFSYAPFPNIEGSAEYPTYLSSGSANGWLTQGLFPQSNPGSSASLLGWTSDLNYTVVAIGDLGPLLGEASILGEEGATEDAALGEWNFYLRNNVTGSFRLLAPGKGIREVRLAGSSGGDSGILFEDRAKLTEKAAFFPETVFENGTNLYEWKNGVVTLVGVLPGGEAPAGGSVAGAGGPAIQESEQGEVGNELPGGATSGGAERFYTQNTISEDGQRVFFTDVGTGQIYVREPGAKRTVAVSGGVGPAYWRAATPNGSYVFYTEGAGPDRNLYRFAVESKTRESLTTGEAHVLGTLGISNDGSYTYFVAESVLPGTNGAKAGEANLYEWHEGALTFIASLNAEGDKTDWTDFNIGGGGADEGGKTSRVTPLGTSLLFSSFETVTSYNNAEHNELYLYDAAQPLSSTNPMCVSCNPTVDESSKNAYLAHHFAYTEPEPHNNFLTNNLSDEGNRVFFQTAEALVQGDTNDQMDVYEWEKKGAGSCIVETGDGDQGCLYLVSTGQSASESYFGDASLNGDNIFFFTRQPLVAQDLDDNVDVYDAREDGGLESQDVVQASPCSSEECRGSVGSTPTSTVPPSAALFGAGNLAPPAIGVTPPSKQLTRKQKLANARKACGRKPKRQRAQCEIQAKKKYGAKVTTSRRRAG